MTRDPSPRAQSTDDSGEGTHGRRSLRYLVDILARLAGRMLTQDGRRVPLVFVE